MTNPATTSLLDRANLDRDPVRNEVARGLAGADDGELFLEYSQTEALMFDNGRLKQATYDTSQGFGLRAVKDDAVGYAHASDVSLPALDPRRRCGRAPCAAAIRALSPPPPPHTNVSSTPTTIRSMRRASRPRSSCWPKSTPMSATRIRGCGRCRVSLGATWQVVEILRPDGESYRDIRPLVRVNVSVVAGQGDRQESGSKGYGGREGYARFIETKNWRDAADGAMRQALVNLESVPAPAGEMDVVLGPGWPGVMLHEAVGHGLEGDFNRKKTSAFAGLMGQQVAAKGVTVVDDGTIAVAPRLAVDRRRGHADQPHRADRGRHSGRLHAGPSERAADEHEADRQRPPPELRPCADAAHDQHLHAGGRRAIRRRSSPR